MSSRQIIGLYRKFFNNQPLPNAVIKIRPSKNDFDLEAGYPVEEKEIMTTETGNLPTGFELWANASGFEGSKYVFTEPDGFKWEAILPSGNTPISIQELRAGGTIVTPPDTVLQLIANTDLDDLRDVEFNALNDGDAVVWDVAQQKFVNRQIAGGSGGGLSVEQIQDSIAAMLQAGANTTLTYNDGANSLTIGETSAAITSEQIQDMIAAFIQAGSNIALTYNDAGNILTIAATGGGGTPGDNNSPTTPTAAAPTGITNTGFTANWNAATDNVGVTGYRLQVTNAADTGFANVLQTHDVGNVLSRAITGVSGNLIYRVQAHDAANNYSAFSAAQSVATTAATRAVYFGLDSIFFGAGGTRQEAIPYIVAGFLSANYFDHSVGQMINNPGVTTRVANWGISGRKLDQWLTANPAELDGFFLDAVNKQAVITGGTNDVGLGDTVQSIKDELDAVIQLLISRGVDWYVTTIPFSGTILSNPAINAKNIEINNYLVATYPANRIFRYDRNVHTYNMETASGDGVHFHSTAKANISPSILDLINGVYVRPTINTPTLPNPRVGTPYTQTIAAASGIGALTAAVHEGVLPACLTLNASARTLTGTPAVGDVGAFDFTLRVVDSRGNFDFVRYTGNIEAAAAQTTTVDNFDRADGAVGNGWTAMADSGVLAPTAGLIVNNRFSIQGPNEAMKGYTRPEAGTDMVVECDFIGGGQVVLYVRYQESGGVSSCYTALASDAGYYVDIYKNINGAGSATAGTANPYILQSGDTVRLKVQGPTLTFSYIRAGVETIIKQTTDANITTPGKTGVTSSSANCTIDNYKVMILS